MAFFGKSSGETDPFVQRLMGAGQQTYGQGDPLGALKQQLLNVSTSEDVADFGIENLQAIADADPEFFKAWKAENPKAYVPGQPMIVNGNVHTNRMMDGTGRMNGGDADYYMRDLAESADNRRKAQSAKSDAEMAEYDKEHIGAAEARHREEARTEQAVGPMGYARQWTPFFEAFNAIGENSGRDVSVKTNSLNLPDSETGAVRGPRPMKNSNPVLDALRRARDQRERTSALTAPKPWSLG